MTEGAGPRLPGLDARLKTVLSLVPRCEVAADIGADHGRLSLHLLHRDICREVIVSDISEASLQKARKLLAFHKLSDRARFVAADGFHALNVPVGAVVVTGLGGDSIADMLREGWRVGEARLILSAQTKTPLLRGALNEQGFAITGEHVLRSAGRYYTVIEAQRGSQALSEAQRYTGWRLSGTPSASVADYLAWRLHVLDAARNEKREHRQWLEEAIRHAAGKQSDHL